MHSAGHCGAAAFDGHHANPTIIGDPPIFTPQRVAATLFDLGEHGFAAVFLERRQVRAGEHPQPVAQAMVAVFERRRTIKQRREADFETVMFE